MKEQIVVQLTRGVEGYICTCYSQDSCEEVRASTTNVGQGVELRVKIH